MIVSTSFAGADVDVTGAGVGMAGLEAGTPFDAPGPSATVNL